LPAGFDEARIHAAALSLTRKRSRAAARMWPRLSRAAGAKFGQLFAAYAESAPLPQKGGPLADGRAFARWLHERGELPEAGRLEALAVDLRYSTVGGGLIRRRWPAFKAARDTGARRFILAVRLTWIGEYWLSFPVRGGGHKGPVP